MKQFPCFLIFATPACHSDIINSINGGKYAIQSNSRVIPASRFPKIVHLGIVMGRAIRTNGVRWGDDN